MDSDGARFLRRLRFVCQEGQGYGWDRDRVMLNRDSVCLY